MPNTTNTSAGGAALEPLRAAAAPVAVVAVAVAFISVPRSFAVAVVTIPDRRVALVGLLGVAWAGERSIAESPAPAGEAISPVRDEIAQSSGPGEAPPPPRARWSARNGRRGSPPGRGTIDGPERAHGHGAERVRGRGAVRHPTRAGGSLIIAGARGAGPHGADPGGGGGEPEPGGGERGAAVDRAGVQRESDRARPG